MKINAQISNYERNHQVILKSGDKIHSIYIPPKADGFGSSANGGELLFLSLATCYCNDIYREAAKMEIKVEKVEVEVSGEFGEEGEPAKNITYNAKVIAKASKERVHQLLNHTDKVAEIQNTLRVANTVILSNIEVVSVQE